MKKLYKSIACLLMAVLLITSMPVSATASTASQPDKANSVLSGYKLDGYPVFPEGIDQQYFIIYTESFRDNRVEICFFDVKNKADLMYMQWQGKGKAIDAVFGKVSNDKKYFINKSNKWELFEEGWGRVSSGATKLLCSNINIYGTDGNRVLKKTVIKYFYYEKNTYTCDIGDKFTPKIKTNISGSVKYSSSKTSVVSVDSKGKITAHKAGTAIITARSKTGKITTCKIKVNK